MFNVSCKDAFETETVGKRRQRKFKETQDGIDSVNDALSRCSLSPSPVFSSPKSERSSRTPTLSPISQQSPSPQKPLASIRDYFSHKTPTPQPKPISTDVKHGQSGFDAPSSSFANKTKRKGPSSRAEGRSHTYAPTIASSEPCDVASCADSMLYSQHSSPQQLHLKRCQRLLRKIEMASDKEAATRLGMRWPLEYEDEIEMMHEFHFETALYALVCSQKMMSRQLRGHGDEVFLIPGGLHPDENSLLESGNILHLGATRGSAESWYMGTRLPGATIHSLGLKDLPFDVSSSSWGLPPNLLLEQWYNFPQLDYVDQIFDAVIISTHLFESVKCTLWPALFEDISRVLAQDGLLVVSVMDALPQQSGTLLNSWIHDNIYMNLLRRFMVYRPSLLLPSWLDEGGRFTALQVHQLPYPCMPVVQAGNLVVDTKRTNTSGRRKTYSTMPPSERLDKVDECGGNPGALDGTKEQLLAASLAGWNCYERVYGDFGPPPRPMAPILEASTCNRWHWREIGGLVWTKSARKAINASRTSR